MKIELCLPDDRKVEYINHISNYLMRTQKECNTNINHRYFQITNEYLNEIRLCLGEIIFPDANEESIKSFSGDSKALKYLNITEAYRLIRYQYSRYSQHKQSYTDGVYSSFIAEILRYMHRNIEKSISILDAGSGPSRLAYELSSIFTNSKIDLIDYSIFNLFFAWKLICSGEDVRIPYRIFRDIWEVGEDYSDTEVMTITSKANNNIFFKVNDLNDIQWDNEDGFYDLIVSNHALNLTVNPKRVSEKLIDVTRQDGFILISDLLGWKENRPISRRDFPDGAEMLNYFKLNKRVRVVDYFSGGPYLEEVSAERYNFYKNHLIILQKR
ncbi:hypothetical protein MJA45_18775 [Paenibacillus aurantius]|uniref:Uncharacterized protein n=1 Tax=Paenibacillus aurantius TaxID=2918900 RepID=A0AA96LCM9_9BACL|nr:hypothetical protein [Paenibacillus aurantius]WNQ09661.1 hypothetical protein MJA45_18775 [Paenibacillus aurantius]